MGINSFFCDVEDAVSLSKVTEAKTESPVFLCLL